MASNQVTGERVSEAVQLRLTIDVIVEWAREHHARTGAWPGPRTPGIIPGTEAEKWRSLDYALRFGGRGLPAGSSLMRLLADRCGARNRNVPPQLSVVQILAWADAHFARHGRWPTATAGTIPETVGESWGAVSHALCAGSRGLPGGSSLACLLAEHRGRRNKRDLSKLSEGRILAWADDHYRRTKTWPHKRQREPIPNAPGETWTNLDAALRTGTRGLPGGSSLARLLAEHRSCRNRGATCAAYRSTDSRLGGCLPAQARVLAHRVGGNHFAVKRRDVECG